MLLLSRKQKMAKFGKPEATWKTVEKENSCGGGNEKFQKSYGHPEKASRERWCGETPKKRETKRWTLTMRKRATPATGQRQGRKVERVRGERRKGTGR